LQSYREFHYPSLQTHIPYSLNIGSNVTYVKGTIKLVKISE
jgi:hypothetical protein